AAYDAPGRIDAAGPASYVSTLPVDVIADRLRGGGVAARLSTEPPAGEGNRLHYALLHYAALRGSESWFQRLPPAGMVSLVGLIELPLAGARSTASDTGPAAQPPVDWTEAVGLSVDAIADYLRAASVPPSGPGAAAS